MIIHALEDVTGLCNCNCNGFVVFGSDSCPFSFPFHCLDHALLDPMTFASTFSWRPEGLQLAQLEGGRGSAGRRETAMVAAEPALALAPMEEDQEEEETSMLLQPLDECQESTAMKQLQIWRRKLCFTPWDETSMSIVSATGRCQPHCSSAAMQMTFYFGCSTSSERLKAFWATVFPVSLLTDMKLEVRHEADALVFDTVGGPPVEILKLLLLEAAVSRLLSKLSGPGACLVISWVHGIVWSGCVRRGFTLSTIAMVVEAAMQPFFGPCSVHFTDACGPVSDKFMVSGNLQLGVVVTRRQPSQKLRPNRLPIL